MNLLENKIKCIECKSKNLIKDYKKQEIYCGDCGLVLIDNTLPNLNDLMTNETSPIVESGNKKKRKIDYLKLKEFLYNFY